MLERTQGKGDTPPLLTGVQTLKIGEAVSQKIGNQPTQDPAITILGIYPKNAQSYYKGTCSTMFITALFVIARTWKKNLYAPQPRDG